MPTHWLMLWSCTTRDEREWMCVCVCFCLGGRRRLQEQRRRRRRRRLLLWRPVAERSQVWLPQQIVCCLTLSPVPSFTERKQPESRTWYNQLEPVGLFQHTWQKSSLTFILKKQRNVFFFNKYLIFLSCSVTWIWSETVKKHLFCYYWSFFGLFHRRR